MKGAARARRARRTRQRGGRTPDPPLLLRWWPVVALGVTLTLGGLGAWYDIRQRVAVTEAKMDALKESIQFLAGRVVGPHERGR
jgi:hypothetical protein